MPGTILREAGRILAGRIYFYSPPEGEQVYREDKYQGIG
jgi:hypothetical protein